MAKVVYNACYGGFDLSDAGMRRYAEIKGITLYPEYSKHYPSLGIVTYWTVPEGERIPNAGDRWHSMSTDERIAYSAAQMAQEISHRDFDRCDPVLVQVVEELGAEANTRFSDLKIAEVPSGGKYRIDEYDGHESVETPDSYDWKVAP